MFFGFYCVRRLLISLNMFLILLSIILISVAVYAYSISIVTTSIIGGIIFCGIFLFLISFIGLFGTLNHNQVLLFIYMVTLSICFIIQFVIACVCLGVVSVNSQTDLLFSGWQELSDKTIEETQFKYNCCGFNNVTFDRPHVKCPATADIFCFEAVKESVVKALEITGGIALAFSFMNLFGVWLAMRFRNQRDPKANPNAFL